MHAIILVGGRGTRLQPLTDTRPKPMLPILDRPFLEHQLRYLKSHGVTGVTFACGFMPGEITSYFGEGDRVGLRLNYVIEPEPLDTAGAIAFAARTLEPQRLLVCNGDVLTDLDVDQLVAAHEQYEATATIALTPVEDPTRYGLVRTGARDEVLAFLEKPTLEEAGDDRYINAGTYVLEPSVFELVPEGIRCNIEREVFPQLVGKGLHAIGFDGYWNDIGTHGSYLRANVDALAGRVAGIAAPPGGRWIAPDAVVHPDAVVRPGTVVGAGARIDAGAIVEHSVVLERAHVGADARISGAILGEDSEAPAGKVLGGGAVIAPGSKPSGVNG